MSRNCSRNNRSLLLGGNFTFLVASDALTTLMGQYITPVNGEFESVASSRVTRKIQSDSSLAVILSFPDFLAILARLPAHGPTHRFKHSSRSCATSSHAGVGEMSEAIPERGFVIQGISLLAMP